MNGELHEDSAGRRLGKAPFEASPADFKLKAFLADGFAFPQPPTVYGHGYLFSGTSWLMLGNGPDDTVRPGFRGCGCCVFSMIAHVLMEYGKLRRRPIPITGKEVVAAYSEVTGYVVDDDSTDNGTVMRDALNWWRKVGFRDAAGDRHKLTAFLQFDPTDYLEHTQATFTIGATALGFVFPDSAWAQFNAGGPFDVPVSRPDGGHAVPEVGRRHADRVTVVTWAERIEMTKAFLRSQVDEAWALLLPEELNSKGLNERGLDAAKLQDALASLH